MRGGKHNIKVEENEQKKNKRSSCVFVLEEMMLKRRKTLEKKNAVLFSHLWGERRVKSFCSLGNRVSEIPKQTSDRTVQDRLDSA